MMEAKPSTAARKLDSHAANGFELASQDKQRGLFSFLTWPFYLAQAVTAQAILDGTLRSALADEDSGGTARAKPTDTPSDSYDTALGDSGTALGGAEDGAQDARADVRANLVEASAQSGRSDSAPSGSDDGTSSSAGQGGGSVSGPGAGSGGGSSASPANAQHTNPSPAQQGSVETDPSPEVVGSGVIAFPAYIGGVHETAAPVLESMGSVVATTTDVAMDVIGQVFEATDIIIDTVPAVLNTPVNVVTDLVGSFGTVVATSTEAAMDVIEQVFDAADIIIDTVPAVLNTPANVVTDLVGDAFGSAQGLVGTLSPLVIGEHGPPEAASTTVAAVADIVADAALPLEDLGGALASGGLITFDRPALALPADDLFANGQHTDYGLALTDVVAAAEPILDTVDRGIEGDQAAVSTSGQGPDTAQSTRSADAVVTSVVSDMTGSFDDLGLRASDSLL